MNKMIVARLVPEYDEEGMGLSTYLVPITRELRKIGVKNNIILIQGKRPMHLVTGITAYKKLKNEEKDIIHHHNPLYTTINLFKKEIKEPIIYTLHNDMFAIKKLRTTNLFELKNNLIFYYLSKYSIKKSDYTIVGSKEGKRLIQERLGKMEVEYIPSGYDPRKFYKEKNVEVKNQILYVGRFSKQKNIEGIIDLFKELRKDYKELRLILVGGKVTDDGYTDVIRKIIEERLLIEIDIIPSTTQDELRKIYNESKATIILSKAEGTCKVGIESLACGTPIISNGVGGVKDYLRNGENGYYIDSISFERIDRLRRNCVNSVKSFTWKNCAKKHKRLYEKVLSK